MKERPILFSALMVKALLADQKTQTRRVAKFTDSGHLKEPGGPRRWHPDDPDAVLACPYGQPGDRLWVKECYSAHGEFGDEGRKIYRADIPDGKEPNGLHWRPSIFMSRAASRLTLELTAVRVERLNDISEEDARAEGVERISGSDRFFHSYFPRPEKNGLRCCSSARESYQGLWESLNGPSSWAANPWVWALTFKKL